MKQKDDILENQIKFYENLLKTYNRLSDNSHIGLESRENTVNRILDILSELYKQREK